jgi:hypothetical protein
MIFNWDGPIFGPTTNLTDWDGTYSLYVPPTPDDPIVIGVPMIAYFGLVDTEAGTVAGLPRVAWVSASR